MNRFAVLSYFDGFEEVDSSNLGLYEIVGQKMEHVGVGFYNILLTAGVYASAIAMLVSAVLLMYASKGNSTKLSEAKKGIVRTFFISVAIFAVTGAISLVQEMALH